MELDPEFSRLLDTITPEFQEHLIRAFRNEAVRNSNRRLTKRFQHKINNILLSLGDTKIELGELTFPWIPDFRIVNMSVDLRMLYIDVNLKLGDLKIEGEYQANSLGLLKYLPLSNTGKIEIIFKDVTAKGKVGLLIDEDSLVPENYDVKYEKAETNISVKYFVSSEKEIENKTIPKNEEDVIGDSVWSQLYGILTTLLDKQLGEVVVEHSLTELLADEDEHLRQLAREHSTKANRLLDSLLCTSKDYLVAKDYRSIQTPPFDVVYQGNKPSGVHQGNLKTGKGFIRDLSTLSRLKDLSFYENSRELVVYGSLHLREFKHGYENYTSHFEETEISGSIKTTVYKNRIFIKLSMVKEGSKTQLDTLRALEIDDIETDTSGLASLSWLAPQLEGWTVGNLWFSAIPVLERSIQEAFRYAIDKTDCIKLLRD